MLATERKLFLLATEIRATLDRAYSFTKLNLGRA